MHYLSFSSLWNTHLAASKHLQMALHSRKACMHMAGMHAHARHACIPWQQQMTSCSSCGLLSFPLRDPLLLCSCHLCNLLRHPQRVRWSYGPDHAQRLVNSCAGKASPGNGKSDPHCRHLMHIEILRVMAARNQTAMQFKECHVCLSR
jgi:hypothetical protein